MQKLETVQLQLKHNRPPQTAPRDTGTPLTWVSNAGGVGRTCGSEPIFGFTACCERCNRPAVDHGHRPTSCDTYITGRMLRVFDHPTTKWLLTRPAVHFTLHCSDESNTPPEIFKHRFYELCHEFKNYYRKFTDGSKEGNRVAAAVVHRDNTKCVRLPDTASIIRAELYAILLAIDVVRRSNENNFVIFSDSMSSLQSVSGFNLDSDLVQKFLKDYTISAKNGKNIVLCWIPSHV